MAAIFRKCIDANLRAHLAQTSRECDGRHLASVECGAPGLPEVPYPSEARVHRVSRHSSLREASYHLPALWGIASHNRSRMFVSQAVAEFVYQSMEGNGGRLSVG